MYKDLSYIAREHKLNGQSYINEMKATFSTWPTQQTLVQKRYTMRKI